MLPHLPPDEAVTLTTTTRNIYINPNFNRATTITGNSMTQYAAAAAATSSSKPTNMYVNPLFLHLPVSPQPPSMTSSIRIHMNPEFLQLQHQKVVPAKVTPSIPTPSTTSCPVSNYKIFNKSRMCLVRTPQLKPSSPATALVAKALRHPVQQPLIRLQQHKLVRGSAIVASSTAAAVKSTSIVANAHRRPVQQQPIIRVRRHKLVRRSATVTGVAAISTAATALKTTKSTSTFAPSSSVAAAVGRYKIDHRRPSPRTQLGSFSTPLRKIIRKRTTLDARYALRRACDKVTLNRKLLNINGVLYKSTRNTLQRKDVAAATATSLSTATTTAVKPKPKSLIAAPVVGGERTLFVSGTKFVMDAQGFRLTRVSTANSKSAAAALSSLRPPPASGGASLRQHQRQRIDIGGLTYVASAATQNVFVRTRNHEALAHLHSARQRSLQLLSRSRLSKSNVPCPIFRLVGRCAAYEQGRCSKVHDKLQVIICPRFLRSGCDNANCLLSHNVSLSKMPVCRFFLLGLCVRNDCPYLHKKLSHKAEICLEFLRGFCRLADKCKKRHVFLCPEFERNGKCEMVNCRQCKIKNRREKRRKLAVAKKSTTVVGDEIRKLPAPSSTKEETTNRGENTPTVRYFNDGSKNSVNVMDTHCEKEEKNDDEEEEEISVKVESSRDGGDAIASRPKVGTLPAFIPLS